ncbi:MAG: copper resistance protein CopZ [Silicimonas sp.]|nr:copper resistance protein CopZ [Silicimonas sp.]
MKRFALLTLALSVLVACKEDRIATPDPVGLTPENVSFFCQMNVLEHGGPKAQIHLEGQPAPLFFAQVRDAIAYIKSPERDARILITYVSDMSVAEAWNLPGIDNWIDSEEAVFVIDAGVAGGMGAPEIVPFSSQAAAQSFADNFGGRIVPIADIPIETALGPVDPDVKLKVPN